MKSTILSAALISRSETQLGYRFLKQAKNESKCLILLSIVYRVELQSFHVEGSEHRDERKGECKMLPSLLFLTTDANYRRRKEVPPAAIRTLDFQVVNSWYTVTNHNEGIENHAATPNISDSSVIFNTLNIVNAGYFPNIFKQN